MNKKRCIKMVLVIAGIFFLLSAISISTQAAGLIDETIDSSNNYSKYPIDNYQLDYFVDSSWDWLPWNWGDGIGKSVMYGIYAITNLVWIFSTYISSGTGYLIGEAYSLDFISDTTEAVGHNIQTLAGINENGFLATGFYPGLLLLLIMVMGIYVTYIGLIKRETTKAISALVSFFTIFILTSSFIAYSTTYITRINEFSADISNAALDIGSKMTIPNTDNEGKSSVDAIRDSLFEIQVKKPWMILQYGDSDIEIVGAKRVEALESTSPFANKGKDRVELVKEEINDKENDNMTITKTISRLGIAIFIFFFNVLISVFVFILTGIMIFSQVLFIIFAIFLPISFLLSMIPSFNHLMKTTMMRLFNVIMMRAGITLVLTLSFSISAMVYGLTKTHPFFIVAFLQIVVFAGIYFKLNDLMGMMTLSSSDSQSTGSRIMRRPRQTAKRTVRKFAVGGLLLKGLGSNHREKERKKDQKRKPNEKNKQSTKKREQKNPNNLPKEKKNSLEMDKKKADRNHLRKAGSNLEQSKEQTKKIAARKFKQSNYKGAMQSRSADLKTPESKTTKDSKRRNAPTRLLATSRSTPATNQNTKVNPRGTPSKNKRSFLGRTNQTSQPTKKVSKTNSVSQPLILANQRRPLSKGQALDRESYSNSEKRPTIQKGLSIKKKSKLNGKGSKRR